MEKKWRFEHSIDPSTFNLPQARLSTFFENLGWKVYRVPETANILLSGGVNFNELTPLAAEKFQVILHSTMF
jgi:hypothetical protein